MSAILGFDHREGKHTLYPGKDCLKKFPEDLGKHAKSIIFFWKEKNVTVNKKRIKIIYGCRYIYLWDKILKKSL